MTGQINIDDANKCPLVLCRYLAHPLREPAIASAMLARTRPYGPLNQFLSTRGELLVRDVFPKCASAIVFGGEAERGRDTGRRYLLPRAAMATANELRGQPHDPRQDEDFDAPVRYDHSLGLTGDLVGLSYPLSFSQANAKSVLLTLAWLRKALAASAVSLDESSGGWGLVRNEYHPFVTLPALAAELGMSMQALIALVSPMAKSGLLMAVRAEQLGAHPMMVERSPFGDVAVTVPPAMCWKMRPLKASNPMMRPPQTVMDAAAKIA